MSDFDQFDSRDYEAKEFETRLSQEMKRIPPPAGFADRVMSRVAAQPRGGRLVTMPRRSAWIAIAAMLLIGIVLGGWQWRQQQLRRERQQAELVQRQFDLAMQVTQRTLAEVQGRISHAGEIRSIHKH